jgi:hypothetical protein
VLDTGSTAGTLTIAGGGISTTISVVNASFSLSPASGTYSIPTAITATGVGTVWTQDVLVHNNNGPDAYHGPKGKYTNPGTHDRTSPNYVVGKTPLPADAEADYRGAIPDPEATSATNQTWYGRGADGTFYRYQGTNGEVHFNATLSWNQLPAYIQRRFRALGFRP